MTVHGRVICQFAGMVRIISGGFVAQFSCSEQSVELEGENWRLW